GLHRQLKSSWTDAVPNWKRLDRLAELAASPPAAAGSATETLPKRGKGVQLRPDQQRATEAWLSTRRGCIVLPTGTGKTEVALNLVGSVALSTLIVAPVRDLMYQWHRRILLRTGIDAGILGDGVYRVSPLTVTTYDSAFIHMARIGDQFALIVFDECHHLPGPARQDAARMCAAPYRLGPTATPYRSDGRQVLLEQLIGPICYQQKLDEARGDTLADYDQHRIPIHLSDAERQRY